MLHNIIIITILFSPTTWGRHDYLISKQNLSTPIEPSKDFKLVSEGGMIVTNTPHLKMPKENNTILMNVDEELTVTKLKPVKPRKGASYNISEEVDMSTNTKTIKSTEQDEHLQHKETDQVLNISLTKSENRTILNSLSKLNLTSSLNTTVELGNSKKNAVTEHSKKPTILSYDILANMDSGQKYDDAKLMKQLHVPKSSVDPVIPDQIPPTSNKKAHFVTSSGYAEMVTPIVITILVVPVFALLGYMALKRGKEAWKNRHYKRVDFLLDGMYND